MECDWTTSAVPLNDLKDCCAPPVTDSNRKQAKKPKEHNRDKEREREEHNSTNSMYCDSTWSWHTPLAEFCGLHTTRVRSLALSNCHHWTMFAHTGATSLTDYWPLSVVDDRGLSIARTTISAFLQSNFLCALFAYVVVGRVCWASSFLEYVLHVVVQPFGNM